MSVPVHYAIANMGAAGLMRANAMPDQLITNVGKFWLPAVADVGRAGLMPANSLDVGADIDKIWNLQITQSGKGTPPECQFEVTTSLQFRPHDGDPVVIAVGTLGQPIFGGYLTNPQLVHVSLTRQRYTCRVVGWSRDLSKRLISGKWERMYAGEIVREMLAEYTPQFKVSGFVKAGEYLRTFTATDESILSICSRLADLSEYIFYIDPGRTTHFRPADIRTAPDLNDTEHFGALQVMEDSSQVKNRIIVYYSELRSKSQTIEGDGETKRFDLDYVPYEVKSLLRNGELVDPENYGSHYGEDNTGKDYTIDYKRGAVLTKASSAMPEDDTLIVHYTACVPARLIRTHTASQRLMQSREGGDGLYDYIIRDTAKTEGYTSLDDARVQADAELEQYAYPFVSASYVRVDRLFDILTERLQPGMQQRLDFWDYDEPLEISKVDITVLCPDDSYHLRWQQTVSLGQPTLDLADTIIATAPTTTQDETIEITTEEVTA